MALENGLYFGKLMVAMRKTIMKVQKKTFTLDPLLLSLKDSSSTAAKKENWEVVTNELKKFGVRLSNEQKQSIISGVKPSLIKEILANLMEADKRILAGQR